VINGGDGNDTMVLSTNAGSGTPADFTVSSNNALLNGASNETIVLTGLDFGDDTVKNFTTATESAIAPSKSVQVYNDGTDFLDFTDYLTSQTSASGSGNSQNLIATTLQYSETFDFTGATGDGSSNPEVEANEVAVVRMGTTTDEASETFTALNASVVENLFNNDGTYTGFDGADNTFGDLDADDFDVLDSQTANQVVNGDAKAIFMVENADNLGEYKVFELTWDASQADGDEDVTAVEIGSLDFGDSLTYLDDVNLVGSDDHAALLTFGFA
ncbi:MAG: hypothetical protein ACJA0Z_004253, partial [Halioglobus sp.]